MERGLAAPIEGSAGDGEIALGNRNVSVAGRRRRREPGHARRVGVTEYTIGRRRERSQSWSGRRAGGRCSQEHRAMMSSAQFILHITTAGERWDLLAWRYYGDPTNYSPIIMANPNVAIEPVFDAGISIAVPLQQKSTVVTANLPPCKGSQAVSG